MLCVILFKTRDGDQISSVISLVTLLMLFHTTIRIFNFIQYTPYTTAMYEIFTHLRESCTADS